MKLGCSGFFVPNVASRASFWLRMISACWLLACAGVCIPAAAQAQSVCAEVKIQIDQKVSLERQAFNAILKIRNGLEGVQVERIDVNLVFKDLDGLAAGSLFFSRLDAVSGITGSVDDGSGVVAATTTGEAHWLIIPSQGAGGTTSSGKQYQVGATVTYRMTGETADRTVEVVPEVITVQPQPLLDLEYFLPGPVYADDPFTAEVEPSIPFTLGVRITNNGAGIAANTSIESAQPQIIENDQGLLVGFEITSSYVDDMPAQPSLLIGFGDIQPGASRMGRWNMLTTLSGKFYDFSAEYTHADSLGGALTSLLGTVTPYLLTHDVLVDLPGRDGIRDFLAQASTATQDTDTYRVYESDGPTSEVVQEFSAALSGATLSFPASTAGVLVYARAPIGFDGQGQSVVAARSDGHPVSPANVWFSKRRDSSGESWLYFINVFEANASSCSSTCSYALDYDGIPPEASIAGNVYEDVNANGRQDPGESAFAGVSVLVSNGSVTQNLATAADGSFGFASLPSGTYILTVGALANHYDGQHTIGSAGGVPGASSIGNIVLNSTSHGIGYQFAKIPLPDQRSADLRIVSLAASTTTPRVGQTFSLSTQVSNFGPDAAAAIATQSLPQGIEVLSANPSSGTYDASTFQWVMGELAAGDSESLTLQVRANQEGSYSIASSVSVIDASILDPTPANNVANLQLNADPESDLSLSLAIRKESRILALTSCGAQIADEACDADRAEALDVYLEARGLDHQVVTDISEFRKEFRGGHWNVYWIDGGAFKLDDEIVQELGLAVLRGDSLITDGIHAQPSTVLDGWVGASYLGIEATNDPDALSFVPSDYFDLTSLTVAGVRQNYQATPASELANFQNGSPAIIHGMRGNGHVFLFAFDLASMLTDNPAYLPVYQQLIGATAPAITSFATKDALLPLALQLENLGVATNASLSLTASPLVRIVSTSPLPNVLTETQANWETSLNPAAKLDTMANVRMTSNGLTSLLADVNRLGGNGESLGHQEISVPVRDTDQSLTAIGLAIDAIPVVGSVDKSFRHAAARSLGRASAARAEGNRGKAITRLLESVASLDQIASANTLPVRIDLGWLLQAIDHEWYQSFPPCELLANAPVATTGIDFTHFAKREGMLLGQLDQGGFEWRLGTNTNRDNRSVGGVTNPENGHAYQWSLTYEPDGTGSFTVSDQGSSILAETFIPRPRAAHLRLGNGIELAVNAAAGSIGSSVTIAVSSLQGVSLGSSPITAGNSVKKSSASIYYYGESLAHGFSMSGTATVSVPSPLTLPTAELSFRVNAGIMSCVDPSR